jgi:hypothetical protein
MGGVIILSTKKLNSIFISLILSALCFSTAFGASTPEKIPNFGTMKESDTRQSYFVNNTSGKVKKIKMSEMDTVIIARLFNTNTYTEVYIDNQFTPKIAGPYIEIRVKLNRILNLYYAVGGFVFLDKKKQYYIRQDRAGDFFQYCGKKYANTTSNINSSREKYKPISFNTKDFLDNLKKANCNYKILKNLMSEEFSCSIRTISLLDEEVAIYEYKDNIDMEIDAMRIAALTDSSCWAGVPHYFKRGNIIVNYNGTNAQIIKHIEQVMGKQYMGAKLN